MKEFATLGMEQPQFHADFFHCFLKPATVLRHSSGSNDGLTLTAKLHNHSRIALQSSLSHRTEDRLKQDKNGNLESRNNVCCSKRSACSFISVRIRHEIECVLVPCPSSLLASLAISITVWNLGTEPCCRNSSDEPSINI